MMNNSRQPLNLTVYRKEDLAELLESWQMVLKLTKNQCFYQSPIWFQSFFERKENNIDNISFILIKRGNKPIAIIPIEHNVEGKKIKIKTISLPTKEQLYLPDILIADSEKADEIMEYFLKNYSCQTKKKWDIFSVKNALQTSNIAEVFKTPSLRKTKSTSNSYCSIIPVIPYSDARSRMKRKFRKNLNSHYRKLEKYPDHIFSRVNSPEGTETAFEGFIKLESSGWKSGHSQPRGKHRKPAAIALKTPKLEFYRQIIRLFSKTKSVDIFFLRIDNEVVAGQICLILENVCYALKTAYDERYSALSPGHLIQDYAYRTYSEEGVIKNINLISESYADEGWNPEHIMIATYRLFNKTPYGALLLILFKSRYIFNKFSFVKNHILRRNSL